ncbi:MAG: hypothetical protein NTZ18_03820 [Candidatus Komeilibacteria bacterium]|nr:hypothetical protein [Candidatus Komeilibacteria bacterium]
MLGFKPTTCERCGQSENYLLGLDKGTVKIVLAMLNAISAKGKNEIHPAREMDCSGNKKWFLTNLSRPRFHGLIAYIDGKPGYYCLTRKAGQFLHGKAIPQYAIISKVTGHQEGYFEAERCLVTLRELLKGDVPMWAGEQSRMIDYLDPVAPDNGQVKLFNFGIKIMPVNKIYGQPSRSFSH